MTEWVQDGWYGPAAAVAEAKAALTGDPRIGGMLPLAGEAPELCDEGGTEAMFGFIASETIPLPAGLKRASSLMLTRLMGSTF